MLDMYQDPDQAVLDPLVGEVPKFWILVVQPPLCLTKCHLGPFAHHVLCSSNIVRFLRHRSEFRLALSSIS